MQRVQIRALMLVMLFAKCIGAHAQWLEQSAFPASNFHSAYMLDGSRALITGSGGRVFRTTTGGQVWTQMSPTGSFGLLMSFNRLRGAYMYDADRWVVSGTHISELSEIILRTNDGGTTWEMVHLGPDFTGCNDMVFVSPAVGFAVGQQGRVLRTTDVGATWQVVNTPVTSELNTITHLGGSSYLTAGDGVVLRTNDGGQSWSSISNGPPVSSGSIVFHRLAAGSTSRIFATLSGPSFQKFLFRSDDGGVSWDHVPTPFTVTGALHAFNQDSILLAGVGMMYVSLDAGISWYFYPETSGSFFDNLHFINDQSGYAVGEQAIFRTENGIGSPTPLAQFSFMAISCTGPKMFSNESPEGLSYAWYVDGELVSTNYDLEYDFTTSGTYVVELEVSAGTNTNVVQRTVEISPWMTPPVFSIEFTANPICTGTNFIVRLADHFGQPSFNFQVLRNGVPINGTWNSSNSNPSTVISQPTNGEIIEIVGRRIGACDTAYTVQEHIITTVVPYPDPVQLLALENRICQLDTPVIIIPGSQLGVVYTLNASYHGTGVGNGQFTLAGTGSDIVHSMLPVYQGVTVTLLHSRNQNLCSSSINQLVTITVPTLYPNFILPTHTATIGTSIQFNNTTNAAAGLQQSLWTFGGGSLPPTSVDISPSTTFSEAGWNVPVTLTVQDSVGCTKSITRTFVVHASGSGGTTSTICTTEEVDMPYDGYVPSKMVIDSQQNRIVIGRYRAQTWGPAVGHVLFVRKFNQQGSLLWEKLATWGGSIYTSVTGLTVAVDDSDNIYVGGSSNNHGFRLDGLVIGMYNKNSGFMVKMDGAGNALWRILIPSSNTCSVTDILVGNNGSIYFGVAGRGTPLMLLPNGQEDYAGLVGSSYMGVVRVDPDGNFMGAIKGAWLGNGSSNFSYYNFSAGGTNTTSAWVYSAPSLFQTCDGRVVLLGSGRGSFILDEVSYSAIPGVSTGMVFSMVTDQDLSTWSSVHVPVRIGDLPFANATLTSNEDALIVEVRGWAPLLEGHEFQETIPNVSGTFSGLLFRMDLETGAIPWYAQYTGLFGFLFMSESSGRINAFTTLKMPFVWGDGTSELVGTPLQANNAFGMIEFSEDGELFGVKILPAEGADARLDAMAVDKCGDAIFLGRSSPGGVDHNGIIVDPSTHFFGRVSLAGDCAVETCSYLELNTCWMPELQCAMDTLRISWESFGNLGSFNIDWRASGATDWESVASGVPPVPSEYHWPLPAVPSLSPSIIVRISDAISGASDSLQIDLLNVPLVSIMAADTLCQGGSLMAVTDAGLDASFVWSGGDTSDSTAVLLGTNTYTVTVTGENGCSSTATAIVHGAICTGVSDYDSSLGFSVYPVPANDILWLASSELLVSIEVFDMQGRMVLGIGPKDSLDHIRVAGLAPDAYVVHATTRSGERLVVPFIKQ